MAAAGATGVRPDWMEPWMEPFARTICAKQKYVVSSTLERVDWNAELVRGNLGKAVATPDPHFAGAGQLTVARCPQR